MGVASNLFNMTRVNAIMVIGCNHLIEAQSKLVAENILFSYFFFFFFSEQIWFGISSELSARQMTHMKCQTLFSLKTTKTNQNAI